MASPEATQQLDAQALGWKVPRPEGQTYCDCESVPVLGPLNLCAVGPWANHRPSLSFSFPLFKMGVIISASQGCYEHERRPRSWMTYQHPAHS